MSISEFAEAIGVSITTLRVWDKEGKLKPHHRTKGNHRVYTSSQIREYLSDGKQVVAESSV